MFRFLKSPGARSSQSGYPSWLPKPNIYIESIEGRGIPQTKAGKELSQRALEQVLDKPS